jgi:hypothetical protein
MYITCNKYLIENRSQICALKTACHVLNVYLGVAIWALVGPRFVRGGVVRRRLAGP